ncbi:MAG: helix-turn-helix transcriptional regulator [Acidobacteriia bacterium]|nr:helix-turn-helix transcriptional regulator [Terriglobia bacterium]
MTKLRDLHRKWLKEPTYRKAHKALTPEFELARAVIQARAKAGLTQAQLARRMATTQSVIARLESGRARPSTKTLERLAAATGTRLRITFEAQLAESARLAKMGTAYRFRRTTPSLPRIGRRNRLAVPIFEPKAPTIQHDRSLSPSRPTIAPADRQRCYGLLLALRSHTVRVS